MLSDTWRIILSVLTVYRLSMLFWFDRGPYAIMESFRSFLGKQASSGNPNWRTLAELVNCPFCLGIWFSILVACTFLMPSETFDFIILILGIAGGQAFLERMDVE